MVCPPACLIHLIWYIVWNYCYFVHIFRSSLPPPDTSRAPSAATRESRLRLSAGFVGCNAAARGINLGHKTNFFLECHGMQWSPKDMLLRTKPVEISECSCPPSHVFGWHAVMPGMMCCLGFDLEVSFHSKALIRYVIISETIRMALMLVSTPWVDPAWSMGIRHLPRGNADTIHQEWYSHGSRSKSSNDNSSVEGVVVVLL